MKKLNIQAALLLFMGAMCAMQVKAQSIEALLSETAPPIADKKSSPIKEFYKYSELRAYEMTLANGLHIVLRADEGREDVLMTAICPGGASLADDQDFQSAIHAGAIIGNSGFATASGSEVASFLAQKNISLSPGIEEKYSTLKGRFLQADLETFLQAITLYFSRPRKDKTYFDAYIKKLKADALARRKHPYDRFQDTVAALLSTNKSRISLLSADRIKQINLDKAFEIYQRCFGNANGYTFIFTGDFKTDAHNQPSHEKMNLLARYLGALSSSTAAQQVIDRKAGIPGGNHFKEVYNSKARAAAVQMVYSGDYLHTDSVMLQLKVLSYLVEKNLDSLLGQAGADKPSVTLHASKFPKPVYSINISFQCPPKQADQMVALAQQVIANLKAGVDAEQIKQYVYMRKQELKKQTFDYAFWRDYLALQFMNHDDPYDIVHYPYNFYKASGQSLQQAAKEFLTDTNYVQAILRPSK